MRDKDGLYYHPDPTDTQTRVYVRQGADGPEFRLWRHARPEVWEKHGWLPWAVIEAAAAAYRATPPAMPAPYGSYGESGGLPLRADPLRLYDLEVAKALLKHAERGGRAC